MKILILDDQPERHEGFRQIFAGHELTHVWTYDQAVWAMEIMKFDMACLDHDLGDLSKGDQEVRVESENFNLTYRPSVSYGMYGNLAFTGHDLCCWLSKHPECCPAKILIHSWNPDGAKRMAATLKDIPGLEVKVRPYGNGV